MLFKIKVSDIQISNSGTKVVFLIILEYVLGLGIEHIEMVIKKNR